MAETQADPPGGPDSADPEALGAIAAFEDILEIFPDDCSTLDALVHSCELVGDRPKAARYLDRLARSLIDQGQNDHVVELLPKLNDLVDVEPELIPVIQTVRDLGGGGAPADRAPDEAPPARRPAAPDARAAAGDRSAVLEDEMALAWRLHEGKLLDGDEYAELVQDLTDISGRAMAMTVSVLHVLHDRHFRNLAQVMVFVSRQTRAPIIPANAFEPTEESVRVIPCDVAVELGAVCFDLVGNEALVAVLNPYSERLRKAVAATAGRTCHFYLTGAEDFDALLSRARDVEKRMRENGLA